jgi:hypothetical protein
MPEAVEVKPQQRDFLFLFYVTVGEPDSKTFIKAVMYRPIAPRL